MSLKENSYCVLIVTASEKLRDAVSSLLMELNYHSIQTETSVTAARRAILERPFDFVIISSPLPDDPGIRFAMELCDSGETVALLMVAAELSDEIYDRVAEHGVFTLPKPTSRAMLIHALNWMASTRERLRRYEKKTLSIEKKMEEIRIVNRAKWLLISVLKMSEPDAHRYIEKQAMDSCTTRREVAEDIIKTYL